MTERMTISEIAKLAGVNKSTVSRVLNNTVSGRIGAEQRKRIMTIVKATNYCPSLTAQSFATGKTFKIGMILSALVQDLSSPPFALLIQELCDTLQANGYTLSLLRGKTEDSVISFLKTGVADAYIIHESILTPRLVAEFLDTKLPVVKLGLSSDNTAPFTYIYHCYAPAYREALINLRKDGYKEFAFFGVRLNYSDAKLSAIRESAETLSDGPVLADSILYTPEVVSFIADRAEAFKAAEANFDRLIKCKAIFCASDLIAMGLIDLLRQKGIEPGRDIAIIGHDNIEENPCLHSANPFLSTIDPHYELMGKQVAEKMLMQFKDDVPPPVNVTVNSTFIKRRSSEKSS